MIGLFGELAEQVGPERGVEGGSPRLRRPERNQLELRSVDLESLLGVDHPARAIWAYVEKLELGKLYALIRAREGVAGHPPIDPRLMLALWLYAVSDGVGSARALARLCESHDAYRWLCGGVSVNYHTLADFRLAYPDFLDELLAKNVAALAAAGVIELETLAQDGVRVRASAGSSSYRRRATVDKRLADARSLVRRLKAEVAEAPGANEARIRAARARAARQAEERASAALRELEKIEAQRAKHEKTHGKRTKEQKEPRVSLTDPEARVIKMADGGFRPGYNMQIVTAVEQQIIVALDVIADSSDAGQARPMLEKLGRAGIVPDIYLADGGYTKNDDTEWAHKAGITLYCPPPQSKHGTDPYAIRDKDGPGVTAWRERMASDAGKVQYTRRALHECVNARARNWNFRINVRGLQKAHTVLRWFALAHNILFARSLTSPAT